MYFTILTVINLSNHVHTYTTLSMSLLHLYSLQFSINSILTLFNNKSILWQSYTILTLLVHHSIHSWHLNSTILSIYIHFWTSILCYLVYTRFTTGYSQVKPYQLLFCQTITLKSVICLLDYNLCDTLWPFWSTIHQHY